MVEIKHRNPPPWPEKKMKALPEDKICSILYKIYSNSNDEKIKVLARVATTMAKKMDNKLHWYKKYYG